MLETYKAKLRGDHILWNGEVPDAAKTNVEVEVYITILADDAMTGAKRPAGLAAGEFVVPDDFDNPLPAEILFGFEN